MLDTTIMASQTTFQLQNHQSQQSQKNKDTQSNVIILSNLSPPPSSFKQKCLLTPIRAFSLILIQSPLKPGYEHENNYYNSPS